MRRQQTIIDAVIGVETSIITKIVEIKKTVYSDSNVMTNTFIFRKTTSIKTPPKIINSNIGLETKNSYVATSFY